MPDSTQGAETGPSVVAIGGGHGLAVALRAARRYAGSLTAVVSVADDGGSSGRLRRDLDVPAPGDLRKCLIALAAGDGPWVRAFEHRFASGELEGHALGNLLIVGLAEALGDMPAALSEAGKLLGAVGRVLPATADPVVLVAEVGGASVEGQVAVAASGASGRIERVRIVPEGASACPQAVEAILGADQVLLGPGSLYTSVLAALCVPGILRAVESTPGRVVQVGNLLTEVPESEGLDGTDHLMALLDHKVRVDTFLYDRAGVLCVDRGAVSSRGVVPVAADLVATGLVTHDPAKLANALRSLL